MLRIALAFLAASLLFAASGQAAVVTLGSDLTKQANHFEAHGADSAFWMEQVGGQKAAMPTEGQVTFVRVKGSVIDDPPNPPYPDPQFHVQVLRPQPNGTTVRAIISSRPFRLPVTTTESQAIHGYAPVNLCVNKGDFVDFNDIGGFEWRWGGAAGMRVNVFSEPTSGAVTRFYSKNAGTNNGQTFDDPTGQAAVSRERELLMQVVLATGPDATSLCPGGYSQHVFQGLELHADPAPLDTASRTVTVRGGCPFATYGSCSGTLTLAAKLGGKALTVGTTHFKVNPGATSRMTVKVSDANAKLIRKARRVEAITAAESHDDPASDPRAATNKPPVQSNPSGARVLVQADEPPLAKKLTKKQDGDRDGLPDKWEKSNGLNPKKNDAAKDPDKDGLRNADELGWLTDPKKADTDRDKFSDGREIDDGTNPTDRHSFKPPNVDADGKPDATDNCPTKPNSDQADNDKDGKGDVCDTDDDNDGRGDQADNCPTVANANQRNSDTDGLGDACDGDDDGDGASDGEDSCPLASDPIQFNNDGTAPADVCDPDDDDDGDPDTADNCHFIANPDQLNTDQDAEGDACDDDDDGDGVNDLDRAGKPKDNCPTVANASQTDTDNDGQGDACDPDDDNDGVADGSDNCPTVSNQGQVDSDKDGLGNECDPDTGLDTDGDTFSDDTETAAGSDPLDPDSTPLNP